MSRHRRHVSTVRLLRAAAACLLVAATGCGTSRVFFMPAERAYALSPAGLPAAEYGIVAAGQRWGEVRVWSYGAASREGAVEDRAVVEIGFEVENATDATLELDVDLTRIDSIEADGRRIEARGPEPGEADAVFEPHSVGQVDLAFALPDDVEPDDVDAFRLRWRLRGPEQTAYEQFTAFVRLQRQYSYPPHWYDPWFWRWSWGYYW